MVSTADFIANACHFGVMPPLCKITGWQARTMMWDLMHNLYIGTGRDAAGSAIAKLVELKFYSNSADVDDHLKILSTECSKWCSKHHVGVYPPSIDHKSVGLPESVAKVAGCVYPELDQKAAHVKLYLMFLASELFIATSTLVADYEIRVLSVCMFHCAHFVDTLQNAGMWLKDYEADLAVHHGMRFLVLYRYLSRLAMASSRARYRLRPKLHYLMHTVLEMKTWRLNPAYATCFLDEDFMGKIKSIASRTHKRSCTMRTLQRWKIVVKHRWIKRSRRVVRP